MSKNGRPTKYKPEYCEEIVGYFSAKPFDEVETPYGPKKVANPMPTFHKFAQFIGVNEDTVVEWVKAEDKDGNLKYPEFSAAYKRAKELQKWFLIENGLNGVYNATFAIFTAKNITDMRDKTEIDHTSGGEKIKGFNYISPDDSNDKTRTKTTPSLAKA